MSGWDRNREGLLSKPFFLGYNSNFAVIFGEVLIHVLVSLYTKVHPKKTTFIHQSSTSKKISTVLRENASAFVLSPTNRASNVLTQLRGSSIPQISLATTQVKDFDWIKHHLNVISS